MIQTPARRGAEPPPALRGAARAARVVAHRVAALVVAVCAALASPAMVAATPPVTPTAPASDGLALPAPVTAAAPDMERPRSARDLLERPFPWVRMVLTGVCALLAAAEPDPAARFGWAVLGGGLGSWAAYDLRNSRDPTLALAPRGAGIWLRTAF